MYISGILLSAMLTNSVVAQTEKPQENKSTSIIDPAMKSQISKDWNTRNSKLANQRVDWYDSKDGYYGMYSDDSSNYMTRYDKKGTYVQTLTKKEWNESVPTEVRSYFDQSNFRSQEVKSYWEVSDPNKKGYYLELSDKNGRVTKLWGDEKGKFTADPKN